MSSRGWAIYKLGYLLGERGYVRGPFGSSLKRGEMKQNGIPVYEQQHAIYNSRDFRFYIDEDKLKEMKRFQVKTNDLIVSCSGTIGKVSIIKEEDPKGIISQALLILRPDNTKVLPEYLQYYFSTTEGFNNLVSTSHGSVQINIASRDVVENIEIYLPEVPVQRRIVSILSSIDAKIDLNRQINITLETLAQVIFKEWFVDFNFPGTTGEMTESDLGMIPKGWKVFRLHEITKQIKPGVNFQPKRISSGVPFLNVRNINKGLIDLSDVKYVSEDDYRKVHKKWQPEQNDILISRIGTLGLVALIRKMDLPLVVHYNFIDIKTSEVAHQFLYFVLKSDFFQQQYHRIKKATVQEYVTIDEVEQLRVILPKPIEDRKYLEIPFKSILNNILALQEQTQTLIQIREELLLKLISGEIEA